ncbi:family with sequence similarity 162 member A [Phyllostomus discolor]|uniref:Protein FAM162A n=1 Tax=Phyllostomus discolor TaxID=89673 RepID=A0A834AXC0_9CHIR|nr:family with sequence similarity 162 member A [Phyllostomus discolor]
MGSLRGLLLAAGNCRLCERDAFSFLRLTRNSNLKRINGFCTKPQESPKTPPHTYRHRVPLHKPTDWEKKILIWSGRFKKEEEIPETVSFEMLDAAKNKVRVKISYVMIALTVAGCILMVIEGKKAPQIIITLSAEELASHSPLGLNLTDDTASVCPTRVHLRV